MNELKRTQGLCVADLAVRLGMSYMGIKGVCLDLEKRGLLDTWRSPQPLGRPLMLYRLTERAHDLFPTTSTAHDAPSSSAWSWLSRSGTGPNSMREDGG